MAGNQQVDWQRSGQIRPSKWIVLLNCSRAVGFQRYEVLIGASTTLVGLGRTHCPVYSLCVGHAHSMKSRQVLRVCMYILVSKSSLHFEISRFSDRILIAIWTAFNRRNLVWQTGAMESQAEVWVGDRIFSDKRCIYSELEMRYPSTSTLYFSKSIQDFLIL